jgi:hypothetical protein
MDLKTKVQGHLILLNCGHRGKPNRPEEKKMSRLLRSSGFIPAIEEVYKREVEQRKTTMKKTVLSEEQKEEVRKLKISLKEII